MKNSTDIIPDEITVRYWIMYPRGKFLHDVKLRIQLEDKKKDVGDNKYVLDLTQKQTSVRGVLEQTFKIEKDELASDFNRFCDALNNTLKDTKKDDKTVDTSTNLEDWRLIFSITGVNDEGNIITKAKSYDCSHIFLNTKFAKIEIVPEKSEENKEIKKPKKTKKTNKGDGIYCKYQNFNKIICMENKDFDEGKEYLAVKRKVDEQCPTAKVLKEDEEDSKDPWTIQIINKLTMNHYRKYKMPKNIMRSILKRLKIDTD